MVLVGEKQSSHFFVLCSLKALTWYLRAIPVQKVHRHETKNDWTSQRTVDRTGGWRIHESAQTRAHPPKWARRKPSSLLTC